MQRNDYNDKSSDNERPDKGVSLSREFARQRDETLMLLTQIERKKAILTAIQDGDIDKLKELHVNIYDFVNNYHPFKLQPVASLMKRKPNQAVLDYLFNEVFKNSYLTDGKIDYKKSFEVGSHESVRILFWAALFNQIGFIQEMHDKRRETGTLKSCCNHTVAHPRTIYCFTATPLELALDYGHRELVDFFLGLKPTEVFNERTVSKDSPLLYFAAKNGYDDLIKTLRNKGAIGSDFKYTEDSDHFGKFLTPLSIAAKNGHVRVLRALVKHYGMDVNLSGASNSPIPLYLAAASHHREVVAYLINNGAAARGVEALRSAIFANNIPAFNILIEALPEISAKASLNSLLLDASRANREGFVSLLLDKGADVNFVDANGDTPLLLAIDTCNVGLVNQLLASGANPNAEHRNKSSALLKAIYAKESPREMVRALLSAGADYASAMKSNAFKRFDQNPHTRTTRAEILSDINNARLAEYIERTEKRDRNSYKRSFFFNLFRFGYSAGQKADAAKAFKAYIDSDVKNKETLKAHKGALKQGELKTIYRAFKNKK